MDSFISAKEAKEKRNIAYEIKYNFVSEKIKAAAEKGRIYVKIDIRLISDTYTEFKNFLVSKGFTIYRDQYTNEITISW